MFIYFLKLLLLLLFILAIWGLDENGYFKSSDNVRSGFMSRLCEMLPSVLQRNNSSSNASSGSVSQRVLTDLKSVHASLVAEAQIDKTSQRSSLERGKRLLFLFQRDLLPGVSGKILESKGQRDNVPVKFVSFHSKAVAWAFISLLNIGMLFYILLFALTQTGPRQNAWFQSFALWLVVELV